MKPIPSDLLATAALAMSVRHVIAGALLQEVASAGITIERAAEVMALLGPEIMLDRPRFQPLAMVAVGATAEYFGEGFVGVDADALRSILHGTSPASERGFLLAAHMKRPSTCDEIELLRHRLLLVEERSALLSGTASLDWEEFMFNGRIATGEYVARHGDFELSAFRRPNSSQWAWAVTHGLEKPRIEEGNVDGGLEEAKAAAIAAMMRWSAIAMAQADPRRRKPQP